MMSSLTLNHKFLIFVSLSLSLICHLLIINSIILIFPDLPEAFKPKLVFLGSFLKKHDTADDLRQSPPSTQPSTTLPSGVLEISGGLFESEISKPLVAQPMSEHAKKDIKSTFDITQESAPVV